MQLFLHSLSIIINPFRTNTYVLYDDFSLWFPKAGFIENNVIYLIPARCSEHTIHRLYCDSNQGMPYPDVLTHQIFHMSAGYCTMVQLYSMRVPDNFLPEQYWRVGE